MPHNVHPSIRWSKSSPWLESKVLSLDERLELLEKLKEKRAVKKVEKKVTNVINSSHNSRHNKESDEAERIQLLNTTDEGRKVKGNATKRRRSSGLQTQGLRRALQVMFVHATRKKRLDRQTSMMSHAAHYDVPIGFGWSQNSCAYNAIFTSVFVLWCSNRQYWTENLKGMGNTVADLLLHGFSCYEKGEALLEDARDNARHLIAHSTNGLPFGHNTSIENVSIRLLSTNKVVTERYYICPNGHHVHHSDDHVAVLSRGVHEYESIAEWVSAETCHAEALCDICHHAVSIKLRFHHAPPSAHVLHALLKDSH